MQSLDKNKNEPLVAILLVLYNEEKHISSLVNSILNQTYRKLEVLAIDNNSSDNSVGLLQSLMNDALIIRSPYNNGYASGNNILAKEAVKINPEYMFILNTDMVLDSNCIRELVKLAETDEYIGIISPIVYRGINSKKIKLIQYYGGKSNFKKARTILNNNGHTLPEVIESNTFHGGATFIRTDVYKEIGLFNEDNFMYGDELDLSYRLKKTIYKMMVTKKAVAWHFHDWSKKNKKGYYLQYFYMTRNRYLFFHRYNKYSSMMKESMKELIKLPFTIRWAIKKADIKLAKYYYLGFFHGLMNKSGKAEIDFK